MKKTENLKENRVFRSMYGKSKSLVFPEFVLYYRKNRLPFNRLGITVSKKTGHAFERNRAKRVIREAYRLSESRMRTGYDFVFVARSKTKEISSAEVMKRLCIAFEKEKLFENEQEDVTAEKQ